MTTKEVIGELRRMHPVEFGEWAFFVEQFSIDAYGIRLWGGSGPYLYRRIAYEVKVSWSDFQRELRRPEKRAPALDISHQFYFAMPADLAARARPSLPEECGLLAVHDDPARGRFRSPFVSAGYSPRVEVLRAAPLRLCRGFTDWQIINLIRKTDREPGVEDALHLRDLEREKVIAERRRTKKANEARDAAWKRLAEIGRPLLEVGTRWTGDWEHRGRRLKAATVAIEHVDDGWRGIGDARVTFRLVLNGEPVEGWHHRDSLPAGEFLERFRLPIQVESFERVV